MKKTTAFCVPMLVGMIAFAFLSVHAQDEDRPAPRSAPAIKKWEHLALQRDASKPFSDSDFAQKVNKLGADGWELVTVLNFSEAGTTAKTVYYFKRPLG